MCAGVGAASFIHCLGCTLGPCHLLPAACTVDPLAPLRQCTALILPAHVNTNIHTHRPDGLKKAYVRLSQDSDALDIANKIGII